MNSELTSVTGLWVEQRLLELAQLTDIPGEMTRLTLSSAHKAATARLKKWFEQAGMRARLDGTGTLIGRYEANLPNVKTLLIGSHTDTVRNAGIYDGTLGVVAGLAVVEELNRRRKRLPFAIEVCAFADEEGVRFASTLTGSRLLAGKFDPAALAETDADGISRRAALEVFGAPVASLAAQARDPAAFLGYLEVHIEQGPVLEARGLPLGIVTAINGVTRGDVRVSGMAGHAGTLPMAMRHDALAAAAEMMLAMEACAKAQDDLVATVGTLQVQGGGAINVVPGEVRFSFDVRAPQDEARLRALADIERAIAEIAARRGVRAAFTPRFEALATPCDRGLRDRLKSAIHERGLTALLLPSGAGHDAMSFRGVLPVAMLFVRCKGGISHNPAEHATPEDMGLAVQVLFDCVMGLA